MSESRVIVLGDSVSWGQGLKDKYKYSYLVTKALNGTGSDSRPEVYAHSGAYLGISHPGTNTSIVPEIPNPAPLIVNQLTEVDAPLTADVVLIHGGINDIDFRTILSPLTPLVKLKKLIHAVCHEDMCCFLRKMVRTIAKSKCRYALGGYYPILSEDSCLLLRGKLDPSFELFLKIKEVKLPPDKDKAFYLEPMIKRALLFWRESTLAFQQAVEEVAVELSMGKRLMFVPAPMKETNALFATDPWLWGIKHCNPEDQVAPERERQCNIQYKSFDQRLICHFASVGHPNAKAASEFAKVIKRALDSV